MRWVEKPIIKELFTHSLLHHKQHLFISSIGLYFLYVLYGSITIWELLLFLAATYLPVLDEFIYAVLHYVDSAQCRTIINQFFVGNVTYVFEEIHALRNFFKTLPLHNFLSYTALWFLWYGFFVFDFAPGLYFLTAVQLHLLFDLINDYYEFGSVNRWFWPIQLIVRGS